MGECIISAKPIKSKMGEVLFIARRTKDNQTNPITFTFNTKTILNKELFISYGDTYGGLTSGSWSSWTPTAIGNTKSISTGYNATLTVMSVNSIKWQGDYSNRCNIAWIVIPGEDTIRYTY